MTDDDERAVRMALMRADIALMRRRAAWIGPRTVALLIAAVAALVIVVGIAIR